MSDSGRLSYVGSALTLAAITSIVVVPVALFAIPTPYLWAFLACWSMLHVGIVIVSAGRPGRRETCRYCGEYVDGGDDSE